MNRSLPKAEVGEVVAMAVFEPNGAHRLDLYLPRTGLEVPLTADEAAQVGEKIAAFQRERTFEEARPVERTTRRREAI